ncbi:MAG TPA: sodium-translocating pyrophosphatase, partial [Muricauda sp.]|nr:sodium-translocating pyrophosphatase [Allomuricauda sp.]
AAIGKGFAIASAALTALALFAAFMKTAGVTSIDVSQPDIMAGLLLGGMLPFVFSALSMNAVGRAAMAMIEEVRRQFRDIPQLKAALEVMRKYDSDISKATAEDRKIFDAADGLAEYEKCVAISTQASIKEMVLPGLLAIAVPVAIGFIGGAEMLGGLLAGVTTAGVLMAIFQSNAGGAWDNAKKTIESEGRKGSDAHKAAVVGDTVGDPFKDTSGPSLNILLKLMSVVALVIAPSLVSLSPADGVGISKEDGTMITITEEGMKETRAIEKEIRVEISNTADGKYKAVVTSSTNENGEVVEETEELMADSKEELEKKIQEYKSAEAKD